MHKVTTPDLTNINWIWHAFTQLLNKDCQNNHERIKMWRKKWTRSINSLKSISKSGELLGISSTLSAPEYHHSQMITPFNDGIVSMVRLATFRSPRKPHIYRLNETWSGVSSFTRLWWTPELYFILQPTSIKSTMYLHKRCLATPCMQYSIQAPVLSQQFYLPMVMPQQ